MLGLDQITSYYTTLAWSFDELPEAAKRACNPLKPDEESYDFATCMSQGWRWVFEAWREHQPKAWAALESLDPRLLYAERFYPDPRVASGPPRMMWEYGGYIVLGERCISFQPCFRGFSIEDAGEDHPAFERFNALPRSIAQAYYARINGLRWLQRLPGNPLTDRVLPAPLWRVWPELPDLAEVAGVPRGDAVRALRCITGGPWDRRWESRFVVMLDTRPPDDFTATGSLLFIDQESRDARVYHVAGFDFANVALLQNPEAVLDGYMAHVIAGRQSVFDFSEFRTPLGG